MPDSSVSIGRGPSPCGGRQSHCRCDVWQHPPGAGTPSERTRASVPRAPSSLHLISASGPKKRWPATAASGRTLQYSSKGIRTAGRSRGPGVTHGLPREGVGAGGTHTSREHGEGLLEQDGGLFPRAGELLLGEVRLLAQQEVRQGHGEGKVRELGQVPMSLQGVKAKDASSQNLA